MGSERREYPRYETSLSVDYASGDTFLFAYLQNISEMGIFIRTERPMPVGTPLKLRLAPPGEDPLELRGEVVWINAYQLGKENLNPGMGVRFFDLAPEDRERLVELVHTIAYLHNHERKHAN